MDWTHEGQNLNIETLDNYKAFVYIITNILTNKKYIGKKKLHFTTHKRLKGRKNRIRVVKESDWKEYYGSSEEVAKDIVKHGKENFSREIIHLCKTPAEASYWELYEQMTRHVLFKPAEFYNSYVGARIHRKHVLRKDKL